MLGTFLVAGIQLTSLFQNKESIDKNHRMMYSFHNPDIRAYLLNFLALYSLSIYVADSVFIPQFLFTTVFNRLIIDKNCYGIGLDVIGMSPLLTRETTSIVHPSLQYFVYPIIQYLVYRDFCMCGGEKVWQLTNCKPQRIYFSVM